MNVLWFNVSTPSAYTKNDCIIRGWQDSLEKILSSDTNIRLTIAFDDYGEPLTRGNVSYIPLNNHYTLLEKIKGNYSWADKEKVFVENALKVIEIVKPDIIHIFGTEWPFGELAQHTNIPVVVHIQGAIVQLNQALYPPRYSALDFIKINIAHPFKIKRFIYNSLKQVSRFNVESKVWQAVENYMGRTEWDKNLSYLMHPNRSYYHVEEALRDTFILSNAMWEYKDVPKAKLITNGCYSFWKGPDMILRTAKLLKKQNLAFEWNVIGDMPNDLKKVIEKKEGTSFDNCNVHFCGRANAEQVLENLLNAAIYVHTSYVENSPNSICEAQYIGVPIVSTNVGGISSLIEHKKTGILVPANDPYQMAASIIQLLNDRELQKLLSHNSREIAIARHSPNSIKKQLLNSYEQIIKKSKRDCNGQQ